MANEMADFLGGTLKARYPAETERFTRL